MGASTISAVVRTHESYRLGALTKDQIGEGEIASWRRLLDQNPPDSIVQDPASLLYNLKPADTLRVYFLYRGDTLCGVAPLIERSWPLACQFGEVTLARLPLRRLCLLGGSHWPGHSDAYELLFRELLSRPASFDAVYLEDLPAESELARFLDSNPFVRQALRRYTPEPPAPRLLLRVEGSFDDYMARFSPKHRQTLRRKLRKFDDTAPGKTRQVCVTRPEEVDTFIDVGAEISRKTYQWRLLGQGLRTTDETRRRFRFLAEQGWLRSYLLYSGDTACAFLTGYQYRGRFFLDDMGYDPAWSDRSPGTVLQLRVIEDLFANNRPLVYDLGEYGTHKEELATDRTMQSKVFLFPGAAYPTMARFAHAACLASTSAAAATLERVGLKKRLKKWIRALSSD